MPEMLLINPRRRAKRSTTKRRTKARRRNPSPAQKAARANFTRMARARSSNPIRRRRRSISAAPKRRSNPLSLYRRKSRTTRRRRNPISGGSLFNMRSYIGPLKDAAIMGAGAVAMDVGYAYINRHLPVQMQVLPGTLGVGNAVKAILTVALGIGLRKATKGLSTKAAMGSLVVQMRDVAASFLPPSVPVSGLGFVVPGRAVQGTSRVNANTNMGNRPRLSGYVPGPSPTLSGVGAYVPGPTPTLSGQHSRMRR